MRKFFTFLFAALMSVSMFANLVTIGSYELTEGDQQSIVKDDITFEYSFEYINPNEGDLFAFLDCPSGFKITRVEISGDQLGSVSIGWNDANPWQGSSESVAIQCQFEGDITIYCTYGEAAPNKPTISGEDMFSESTTVTIASSTAGATIYYTIDGSNPTEGGKLVYSDPFTLTQSATVKAAAYKNGQYSTIATKNFIKLTPAPVGPNYVVWDTEFLSNIYCGLKWATPPVLVNENNVKDGITCIFSGTQAGNSLANNREMYLSAADSKLTFSHESRNITKIEIYGQGGHTCRDWTWDATNFKLVWEGTPAAAVDLQGPESGSLDVNQIYQMVFTLEGDEPEPQPVVNLKAIEFQVPASWENDTTYITAEDFPGFVATTYDIAKTLSVPSDIIVVFVYDSPGNDELSVFMKYGGEVIEESTTANYARGAFFNIAQSVHIYYPVLDEPAPSTYTLQLVADPEKGSVAVTNLLGSDIIDNGNGNYTVPANAEVTILATPLDGYEFSGWKVGNRWCDFTECGTALNTNDNPLTFTMTADVAYLAEFAAEAPAPEAQYAEIVWTEAAAADAIAEDATYTAPGTQFVLTLYDAGNKMIIDANACRFGTAESYKMYDYRIKSGGASSTKNFFMLNIPEAGTLRIAPRTGSNSATDRALVITQGETELYNAIVQESQAVEVQEGENTVKVYPYVEVPVVAGSVRVSYTAGLNFYSFGFAADSTPTAVENTIIGEKAVKVLRDGQLLILRDGKIYNVQGVEVK